MSAGEVPAHSGPAPAADARPPAELRRGVVGFSGVLFQSITFMAPAIATAFSIPIGMAFGGGATPLAVILALIASLFVASSIAQLAKHMPSAGSFYTYGGATTQTREPAAVVLDRVDSGRGTQARHFIHGEYDGVVVGRDAVAADGIRDARDLARAVFEAGPIDVHVLDGLGATDRSLTVAARCGGCHGGVAFSGAIVGVVGIAILLLER